MIGLIKGAAGRDPQFQSVVPHFLEDGLFENELFAVDQAPFFPVAHPVLRQARKKVFAEIDLLENACHFFDGDGRRTAEKGRDARDPERPFLDGLGEFLDVGGFFERFDRAVAYGQ